MTIAYSALATSHGWTEATSWNGGIYEEMAWINQPHAIISFGEPVGFQAVRAIKVMCGYCGRKNGPEHDMCGGCNAPLAML